MRKLPLLLAAVLLMADTLQLRADKVTLTTSLSTGDNLRIALNSDLQATLAWDNGSEETVTFDGSLKTIPVQGTNLTITSVSGNITKLYLQGNKLTALDVTDARYLQTLLAADNQLETLDLRNLPFLATIDLQGNKLKDFNMEYDEALKDLNIASNSLQSLPTSNEITHYVAANNPIQWSHSLTVLPNAKTVWVQGCNLSMFNLSISTDLHSLCAFDNQLSSLSFPTSGNPELTDLWVYGNKLETLDLSAGTPKLYSLAANGNQLSDVKWDNTQSRATKYVYLQDNALFVNSMPIVSGLKDYCIAPQSNYSLANDYYDLYAPTDFSSLLSYNGWGVPIATTLSYTLTDVKGTPLVLGTDYTEESQAFYFLTGQRGVQLNVTSTLYPDITFVTSAFNVGIPLAIDNVATDGNLKVTGSRGELHVAAPQSAALRVYDMSGTNVINQHIEGTRIFSLPAGVYVANGKKVIVY